MAWSWRDEEDYGGPLDKGLVDMGPSNEEIAEAESEPIEPKPLKPHAFDSLFGPWTLVCTCGKDPRDEIHNV